MFIPYLRTGKIDTIPYKLLSETMILNLWWVVLNSSKLIAQANWMVTLLEMLFSLEKLITTLLSEGKNLHSNLLDSKISMRQSEAQLPVSVKMLKAVSSQQVRFNLHQSLSTNKFNPNNNHKLNSNKAESFSKLFIKILLKFLTK